MSDRRQRQKELRAAKREAERKKQSRRELLRRVRIALVFGLAVVGIFVLGGIFGRNDTQLAGTYEAFRAQETACGATPPPPVRSMSFPEPEQQADLAGATQALATIHTSCGEVVIDLELARSPETVNSFVFLARQGFYDGQAIHRIVPDFVIQGGDPRADGTGGPGYVVADEFPLGDFTYEEGMVAMANRGTRSTGSQFFFVIGDSARHLAPRFNVLGTVVSGQDALQRMAEVETTVAPGGAESSLPLETVYIERVEIEIDGN